MCSINITYFLYFFAIKFLKILFNRFYTAASFRSFFFDYCSAGIFVTRPRTSEETLLYRLATVTHSTPTLIPFGSSFLHRELTREVPLPLARKLSRDHTRGNRLSCLLFLWASLTLNYKRRISEIW